MAKEPELEAAAERLRKAADELCKLPGAVAAMAATHAVTIASEIDAASDQDTAAGIAETMAMGDGAAPYIYGARYATEASGYGRQLYQALSTKGDASTVVAGACSFWLGCFVADSMAKHVPGNDTPATENMTIDDIDEHGDVRLPMMKLAAIYFEGAVEAYDAVTTT